MLPQKVFFDSNIIGWDEPSFTKARQKRINDRKLSMKNFPPPKTNYAPVEIGKPIQFVWGDDEEASLSQKKEKEIKDTKLQDEKALFILWKMVQDTKYTIQDLKDFQKSVVDRSYRYPEEFKQSERYVIPKSSSSTPTEKMQRNSPFVKIYDVPSHYTKEDVLHKLSKFTSSIHRVNIFENHVIVSMKFQVDTNTVTKMVETYNKQAWDGSIIQMVCGCVN